ncbi:hypothetical protein GCM10008940_20840 [Microbulbifer agarilyticus]
MSRIRERLAQIVKVNALTTAVGMTSISEQANIQGPGFGRWTVGVISQGGHKFPVIIVLAGN